MDHIRDPGTDRLHEDLRAFILQKPEHLEIAVAFSGLSPELAGNLDDRLHPQTIDLYGVEKAGSVAQRGRVVIVAKLGYELSCVFGSAGGLTEYTRQGRRQSPVLLCTKGVVK